MQRTYPDLTQSGRRFLRLLLPIFLSSLLTGFVVPVGAQNEDPINLSNELYNSVSTASASRILEWLNSVGGNPDSAIDTDNNTLVHYAATNLLDILRAAVWRGGDCNRKNQYGATPLHFAASQQVLGPGPESIWVLEHCTVDPDIQRICAGGRQTGTACRADPNEQDRLGNTPLHALYAGVENHTLPIRNLGVASLKDSGGGARIDVLNVLLGEVDANPNIHNEEGDAPIMLAIRTRSQLFTKADHVSLFLSHGADPDARNNDGETPLFTALSLGPSTTYYTEAQEIISLLLNGGADPNLRDPQGDTPLIRAARHEDDAVMDMEALLAGGADPCLRDQGGQVAYDHTKKDSEGRLLLYKAGGYVDRDTGLCARDLAEAEASENKLGMDNAQRRKLQSCLKRQGFDAGTPDGIFGSVSRAAIRAWQKAQGQDETIATGYFSQDTLPMLLKSCETRESPVKQPKFAMNKGFSTGPASSLLLLIDVSGSMGSEIGNGNSEIKIQAAKQAASVAVEKATRKGTVEIAVLAFEGDCGDPVKNYADFTSDFDTLDNFIENLQPGGGTPMSEAVLFASQFMKVRGSHDAQDKMIVLLADGENSCGSVSDALSELQTSGVIFRHETVGFGIQPQSEAAKDLREIATASGGEFHHAADATQLGDLLVEFIDTFTVIDMLGTFGRDGINATVNSRKSGSTSTKQSNSSPSKTGQMTEMLGKFK